MGEQIEDRMMAEWVASRLAPGTYVMHVRLGPPPDLKSASLTDAANRALARILLPEADLVHRDADSAEIVEFVVWRPQEAVGQLLYYLHLLPTTPGYEDVFPTMISLRIVSGLEDRRFEDFAVRNGIAFEVFRPAWLETKLAARRGARS